MKQDKENNTTTVFDMETIKTNFETIKKINSKRVPIDLEEKYQQIVKDKGCDITEEELDRLLGL